MKDKMIHPAPRAEITDTTSIAVLKVWTSFGLDGAERALMLLSNGCIKNGRLFWCTEAMR
jgi:hypothetical protein